MAKAHTKKQKKKNTVESRREVLLGKNPNIAKQILATMIGIADHPEASLTLGVSQVTEESTHNAGSPYKAPHAYRGTPPKLHHPRSTRVTSEYRPGKLFKGHRI